MALVEAEAEDGAVDDESGGLELAGLGGGGGIGHAGVGELALGEDAGHALALDDFELAGVDDVVGDAGAEGLEEVVAGVGFVGEFVDGHGDLVGGLGLGGWGGCGGGVARLGGVALGGGVGVGGVVLGGRGEGGHGCRDEGGGDGGCRFHGFLRLVFLNGWMVEG